jgi:UDP-2-acetamido-3-amino-2,3-dideoxy-glucuronate N-acetyltransferase
MTTIHPTAIIDDGARIGEGTYVWHWAHVCGKATIGRHCSLGQNVFVGNDVEIGNNVRIQNNVSVYDAVVLEDDVFCGPSMVFTNVINPRSHISRKQEYRRTLVKHGATIGANATIVCGNTVGRYAMVGAGAVVTSDIPDFALVLGVPARRVGWVCRCGIRLMCKNGSLRCSACGARYTLNSDRAECIPLEPPRQFNSSGVVK